MCSRVNTLTHSLFGSHTYCLRISAHSDPHRLHNAVDIKLHGMKSVAVQMCVDVSHMPRHRNEENGGKKPKSTFVMTLEDFITLFCVCILGTPGLEGVCAQLRMLQEYLPGHHRASTVGYYFSAFTAAVELLLSIDLESTSRTRKTTFYE
jgi:hypothetical protein